MIDLRNSNLMKSACCWFGNTMARLALLSALVVLVSPFGVTQEPTRTLIKAKTIYTVDGQVLSPGQVLVQDGKISFVGEQLELALPATEVEVDTLMPGIVNAAARLGLRNGAEVSREFTPEFDTASMIDWELRDFTEAIDQGVTTVQVLPETESVFAGFACVVKTAGDPADRIVDREQSMVLAVSSDPTSRNRSRSRPDSIYVRQPTNRMGVVWIIRNALHQAKLKSSQVDGEIAADEQHENSINTAASKQASILDRVLRGELSVVSVSRKDYDIRSALELGGRYGFLPTICGGDEVYRMVDEFKSSGAELIYNGFTVSSDGRGLRGEEGTDLRWNVPGKLRQSEIPFCLAGENLLDQARFAVRFGLPRDEALKAITLEPARILKLDAKVGSIAVGKQADLVALTGDPLQATSTVEWTMIDGEIYGN